MHCTYIYNDERFGQIEVLERSNAHGISLRIHEGGVIRLTVRPQTPQKELSTFITQEAEWIANALKRMEKKSTPITTFTPETSFSTATHKLKMTADSPDKKVHLQVRNGIIHVSYPPNVDPAQNEVVQELVRKGIAFAFKIEGQKVLPQRLAQLAQKHGFKFNTVELKDAKSRWGSCSSNKDIMLNVQLMRLPQHLIDHVMLHELCHTIEMNHGPRFHALLNKVDGGKAYEHEHELTKWHTQRW